MGRTGTLYVVNYPKKLGEEALAEWIPVSNSHPAQRVVALLLQWEVRIGIPADCECKPVVCGSSPWLEEA